MNLLEKLTRELRRLGGLLIAVACLPAIAPGTAQVPERLLWEGEEVGLAADPLSDLIRSESPGGVVVSIARGGSTGCWRGYQGHWEFEDDRLHLVRLTDCDTKRDIWTDALPGIEPPLFADWYSGVLRIPRGRKLEHVHLGFESVYERDLYLILANGIMVGRFEVANDANNPYVQIAPGPVSGRAPSPSQIPLPPLPDGIAEGDWLDILLLRRLLTTSAVATKTTITIRGICFPGVLHMPANGAAHSGTLELQFSDEIDEPAIGTPVEATVTWLGARRFHFHHFRILEDGEFLDRRGRVLARPWHIREEESPTLPPMTE